MQVVNQKKLTLIMVLVCSVCLAGSAHADEKQALDESVNQAVEEIAEALGATSFESIKSIAVLPLWGEDEDGYVVDTLKSHLSGSKYALLARSTPEWEKLLGEIKWNTLREDVMSPQTVQSFGKIEGCDAIIYGTVRDRKINPYAFKAITRLTLHMADVESGEIVWSSKPVTASVWLEWPEIMKLAVHHPVVWVVGGLIILLVIWRASKKLFLSATRPR